MPVFKRLLIDHRGAATIEFAIVAQPSIRQIASDAGCSAIAGLSHGEREQLATDYLQSATTNQTFIKRSRMNVSVEDDAHNCQPVQLSAAAAPFDDLLYILLLLAGVRVGEADIRVTGVGCQQPVLVQ